MYYNISDVMYIIGKCGYLLDMPLLMCKTVVEISFCVFY